MKTKDKRRGIRRDGGNNNGPNSNRTNNNDSSKPNSSSGSRFYADLRERLENLDFRSYQTCVLLWLGARGYQNICILRRTSARGRRPVGGADFIAESPHCPGVKTAIQVRHWKTPIQRRAVDELWGYMLRNGIPQGLIVTSTRFYPRTIAASVEFPGRPIRLVSVAQLTGSMAALGLGVESTGDRHVISDSFFRVLGQLQLASTLAISQPVQRSAVFFGNCSVERNSVCHYPPPNRPNTSRLWWVIVLGFLAVIILSLWISSGGPR